MEKFHDNIKQMQNLEFIDIGIRGSVRFCVVCATVARAFISTLLCISDLEKVVNRPQVEKPEL